MNTELLFNTLLDAVKYLPRKESDKIDKDIDQFIAATSRLKTPVDPVQVRVLPRKLENRYNRISILNQIFLWVSLIITLVVLYMAGSTVTHLALGLSIMAIAVLIYLLVNSVNIYRYQQSLRVCVALRLWTVIPLPKYHKDHKNETATVKLLKPSTR